VAADDGLHDASTTVADASPYVGISATTAIAAAAVPGRPSVEAPVAAGPDAATDEENGSPEREGEAKSEVGPSGLREEESPREASGERAKEGRGQGRGQG